MPILSQWWVRQAQARAYTTSPSHKGAGPDHRGAITRTAQRAKYVTPSGEERKNKLVYP